MPKRQLEDEIVDASSLSKKKVGNVLFLQELSDSESEISNESDYDWEDVQLDEEITVTVERIDQSRLQYSKDKAQRKFNHQYRRLRYGLHLSMIPFLLMTLRNRFHWSQDERLQKRLRRSIPKLIRKKFNHWLVKEDNLKREKLRTLLLGLIFWYRSHYKINSNGFRQNFNRIEYLLKYANSNLKKEMERYQYILKNEQIYYGSRPNAIHSIEDVRIMLKQKMANRDYLCLFFVVILNNLLTDTCKIYLCFALPLHDYSISCGNVKWQIKNNTLVVPNKFDTDLLQPYFWIEMIYNDEELYVIDPIVNLDKESMVHKYSLNEPVRIFESIHNLRNLVNQKFHYVVNISMDTGKISDVSPRYISDICYRYFDLPLYSPFQNSRDIRSFQFLREQIAKVNHESRKDHNLQSMKQLALSNYSIPQSISEFKNSSNFILLSLLKSSENLNSDAKWITTFHYINNKRDVSEKVYWKKDVSLLKSRQHWLLLGRTVRVDAQPLKLKKHLSMKNRRENKYQHYEIRELYSYIQTLVSEKPPNTYIDRFGNQRMIKDPRVFENKFHHTEIYTRELIPDGFNVVPIKYNLKQLIKKFNKESQKTSGGSPIKYSDVVTGFDFKRKPGYAMPKISHILVRGPDYHRVQNLISQENNLAALSFWKELLLRSKIYNRIDTTYTD